MKLRSIVYLYASVAIVGAGIACVGGGHGFDTGTGEDVVNPGDVTMIDAVIPEDEGGPGRDAAIPDSGPDSTAVDAGVDDVAVADTVDAGVDDVAVADTGDAGGPCPAVDECHTDGTVDPGTGLCESLPVENGTPCTWGVCWDGLCIGLRDGEFRLPGYWSASDGAVFDPAAEGNGNVGAGLVPAGGAGRLLQSVAVLPKYLRLKAGFDAIGDCGPDDPSVCAGKYPRPAMFAGGVTAFRGTVDGPDNWVGKSSCLGEAAYGEDVVYAVGVIPAAGTAGAVRFDNAWLRIVDEQTCPAIGTVLNGDVAGQFGWKECRAGSGAVQYAMDAGKPYVSVGRSGMCTDISCMSGIMSTPLAATMPNPALKFDYRSGGSAMGGWNYFLVADSSGGELRLADSASWTTATKCIPASEQGRAGGVFFYRPACFDGQADWIDVTDVRIETDAAACP